jgi:hypothetical protein
MFENIDELAIIKEEIETNGVKFLEGDYFSVDFGTKSAEVEKSDVVDALRANSQSTAKLIDRLWFDLTQINVDSDRRVASSENIQRLFISSLKRLTNFAESHQSYISGHIRDKLLDISSTDISSISQDVQIQIIEAQLAITWLRHVANRDEYRAELLEAYFELLKNPLNKSAQSIMRNLDLPRQRAIPWDKYQDRLSKHRAERRSGEETSGIEREQELRTDQGMHGQSNKGFLDHYDEVANGYRFKARSSSTMADLYQNNQKMIDYNSGEFGLHEWGDTDNLGPHEQNLNRYRR